MVTSLNFYNNVNWIGDDVERDVDMTWWQDGKFGLFIHWGPSSVGGVEIGWDRMSHPYDHPGKPRIPDAEYDAYHQRFNPVDFDADQIVQTAKQAGMKYVVFTTKHHDGFANWPTQMSDYNITNTPFERDICRELADAVHRHGLKLGWYYSTRDWYHPDYLVGDNSKYNDFYHGQLRELLTNYGDVAMLWFDHVSGTYSDYRFRELFEMIYELQPNILVNDRAARFVFADTAGEADPEVVALTKGDFDTPEGKVGVFQQDRPWESCMVMSKAVEGGGWSYRPDATTRPFAECAKMLSACVTGCGNLLLNVGPMSSGLLRPEELAVLERFGPWMETYGESLYATAGGPYINGTWGGSTIKGDALYLHVFEWTLGRLTLPALPRKVLECEALGGESVSVLQADDGLVLARLGERSTDLHCIIKLTLDAGDPIPLIAVDGDVEGMLAQEQHLGLEDPMGAQK
ncbi:MAG: alpha-L-fucosidase [Kiritimatiellia bacterium]